MTTFEDSHIAFCRFAAPSHLLRQVIRTQELEKELANSKAALAAASSSGAAAADFQDISTLRAQASRYFLVAMIN
jgi:hypothetical protein